MEGFQFTVKSDGELTFMNVYDVDLLSVAMEMFIHEVGGLNMGDVLEITEI